MSEHTKEPWRVAEESFDNDGIHESVIRGLDDRAAIAVTLEFGPNNPGMREANARRIVACVNAFAGISTENIEENKPLAEVLRWLNERIRMAEQQRDKLLAALESLLLITADSKGVAGYHLNGAVANWDEFPEVNEAALLVTQLKGQS